MSLSLNTMVMVMMENNDQFEYYNLDRDVIFIISRFGDETELRLRHAVDAYMLDGIEPNFESDPEKTAWNMIQDKLRHTRDKRIAGRLGGAQGKC